MFAIEITLFVFAVVGVIGLGIWKSRDEDLHGEKGASDYFLAGRGLNLAVQDVNSGSHTAYPRFIEPASCKCFDSSCLIPTW